MWFLENQPFHLEEEQQKCIFLNRLDSLKRDQCVWGHAKSSTSPEMATIKDHMSARQNLQQLHQDIDTLYYHETLRNDRGDTENMSSLDLP